MSSASQHKRARMGRIYRSPMKVPSCGFLASCNYHEDEAVQECLKLLTQYANDLYGKMTWVDNKDAELKNGKNAETDHNYYADQKHSEDAATEDTGDIADKLQANILTNKTSNKQNTQNQRFIITKTGVKCAFFIRTTLPDPAELMRYILKRYDARTELLTRHTLRLIPIETVCDKNDKALKAAATELFRKHFKEPTTFAIVFKRHYNHYLDRDAVISLLAEIVVEQNADNRVDLKNPAKTIIAEFIRSNCLLTVLDGYYQYRKYNLAQLASGGGVAKKDEQHQDTNEAKTVAENESEDKVAEDDQPQAENQKSTEVVE